MKLSGTLYVRDVTFRDLRDFVREKRRTPVTVDVLRGYLRELRLRRVEEVKAIAIERLGVLCYQILGGRTLHQVYGIVRDMTDTVLSPEKLYASLESFQFEPDGQVKIVMVDREGFRLPLEEPLPNWNPEEDPRQRAISVLREAGYDVPPQTGGGFYLPGPIDDEIDRVLAALDRRRARVAQLRDEIAQLQAKEARALGWLYTLVGKARRER